MPTFEKRFWAKVDKRGPNDCWAWTGAANGRGYGSIWRSPRLERAHRMAYELAYGAIPDGLVVDHMCHNPKCVNPRHLRICTQAQNLQNARGHRDSFSGLKGVSWDRGTRKWRAQILVPSRKMYIGLFDTPEEAQAAYLEEARKHFEGFVCAESR